MLLKGLILICVSVSSDFFELRNLCLQEVCLHCGPEFTFWEEQNNSFQLRLLTADNKALSHIKKVNYKHLR